MKKKKGFIQEFRTFILRGNVMDLAVGVIIGGAFQTIVNSLVKDVIMPVIGIITGGIDFGNLFLSLNGEHYDSVATAEAAGAPLLKYGTFITAVINFLIMAFVIFCLIKAINTLSARFERREEPASVPTTQECPYCMSEVDIHATRCPHCTSHLIPGSDVLEEAAFSAE